MSWKSRRQDCVSLFTSEDHKSLRVCDILVQYLWLQQEKVRSTPGLHTPSTSRRDGPDSETNLSFTYTPD